MIYETLKNFAKQFEYKPEIVGKLKKFDKFVVIGMGGSNLAAPLLNAWKPVLDIIVHRDYGLPAVAGSDLKERLVILSSYSGTTEEVIDAFHVARKKKAARFAITTGGKLLALAKKEKIPYIEMPDKAVEPRAGLGYSFMSHLKIAGSNKDMVEAAGLAYALKPAREDTHARSLAKHLKGFIPVIYASEKNSQIAYVWKIAIDETAKLPAFANAFPEVNHNEMQGIAGGSMLAKQFSFIILKDTDDNLRVQKRMIVLEGLYRNRGLRVEPLIIRGINPLHKIFSAIVLGYLTAYHLAKESGNSPSGQPVVEEFKKLIR